MQHDTSTDQSSLHNAHIEEDTSIHTPQINLYETDDGWLMIAALPQAVKAKAQLETEGNSLTLKVPHESGGSYQRVIEFPSQTVWGEIRADWRDDTLRIDMARPRPERRHIEINLST